jgi:hypothetical protein
VRAEHGGKDFGWAVAAPQLSGAAVVADGRSGSAGSTTLLLAAPRGAAAVRVELYAGQAAPRSLVVRIPADRSVAVDQAGAGRFTVLVTPEPGSGPVYGAVVLRTGLSGLTVAALRSARVSVVVPAVVPDVTVVTTAGRPDQSSP